MKNNGVILVIVVLMLLMTIGYALFSETITIFGTSTANGNFDVGFDSAIIIQEVGSVGATAKINPTKNILTVNVPKLEYPGSYALIAIKVENFGSIPAILETIDEKGVSNDANIVISYLGLTKLKNMVINKGDISEFQLKVMWKADSTAASKDVKFTIKLNYKQAV